MELVIAFYLSMFVIIVFQNEDLAAPSDII
jgi:hypothetical protein